MNWILSKSVLGFNLVFFRLHFGLKEGGQWRQRFGCADDGEKDPQEGSPHPNKAPQTRF